MNASKDARVSDAEIARVAQSIWESEGRPEGRAQDHWRRAREILERGEAVGDPGHAPRPVQPGFEDAEPGMVPDMKQDPDGAELREGPGGRFAKQLADAPEEPGSSGPRDRDPLPSASSEGHLEVPSKEDAAEAISDDPAPIVAGPDARSRAKEG
jgi:hypothetical protein